VGEHPDLPEAILEVLHLRGLLTPGEAGERRLLLDGGHLLVRDVARQD
jgi:hypothetical protein